MSQKIDANLFAGTIMEKVVEFMLSLNFLPVLEKKLLRKKL